MTDADPTDDGDKRAKPKRPSPRRYGREQTKGEREEEDGKSQTFGLVIARGEGWWRDYGWEPSPDDRLMVQMLKFSGYNDEDIAGALHMSVETLLKHFSWELKHAKTLIMGDLATRAYTRARQGNDVLLMFLLKTRAPGGAFSEKAVTAATLADSLKDAEGMPEDRKAEVIRSLVDLLNPKPKEKAKTTKEGSDDDG